ncbi:MAG: toxin [Candidatus Peregrinibacteria bacterium]
MQKIVWNTSKNEWLIENRGISFLEIEDMVRRKEYLDIIENPSTQHENQFLIILPYNDYIWTVPCLITTEEIVLKTAFPSRKLQKTYPHSL